MMNDLAINLIAISVILYTLLAIIIWVWCELKEYLQIRIENKRMKSILFSIGEIAVSDWNDNIVGLVDRTLPKGFKISKEEHYKNLDLLKKKKHGPCI